MSSLTTLGTLTVREACFPGSKSQGTNTLICNRARVHMFDRKLRRSFFCVVRKRRLLNRRLFQSEETRNAEMKYGKMSRGRRVRGVGRHEIWTEILKMRNATDESLIAPLRTLNGKEVRN